MRNVKRKGIGRALLAVVVTANPALFGQGYTLSDPDSGIRNTTWEENRRYASTPPPEGKRYMWGRLENVPSPARTPRPPSAVAAATGGTRRIQLPLGVVSAAVAEDTRPVQAEREEKGLPPTLQARVGEVSEKYQTSTAELEQVTKELLADLNRNEAVPDFKAMKEAERLFKFERFLALLEACGEKSLADGAKFDEKFEDVHNSAAKAARYYWEAETYFRKKELNAKFPEGKAQYRRMAEWYAARAMRCDAQAKVVIPTDLRTERERVRELVDSVKELREWVRNDKSFLRDPVDMEDSLAQFAKGYRRLGEVLGTWTTTLSKGLSEKDLPVPPGTPDARPSPRPVKTASGVPSGGAPAPPGR